MNNLPSVSASRLAVHQVVMNLYDNAMKYGSEDSEIKVVASIEGGYVRNIFEHKADTVLTSYAASRIFDRGFRADEAKAKRAAGTGLGMHISRALMHSMEGELQAYPTDNKNITRFVLQWRIIR